MPINFFAKLNIRAETHGPNALRCESKKFRIQRHDFAPPVSDFCGRL